MMTKPPHCRDTCTSVRLEKMKTNNVCTRDAGRAIAQLPGLCIQSTAHSFVACKFHRGCLHDVQSSTSI